MTDRIVYETEGKPIYIIQFRTENGNWQDTYGPWISLEAAIKELNTRSSASYPHRIVERRK